MFITTPAFEHCMPVGSVPSPTRAWVAMTMLVESAWFLARVRIDVAGEWVMQTMAVACQSALLDVLEDPAQTLVRLDRLSPSVPDGAWVIQNVSELWLAAPKEVAAAGLVLFALRGDPDLVDCSGNRICAADNQRELVVRLPT